MVIIGKEDVREKVEEIYRTSNDISRDSEGKLVYTFNESKFNRNKRYIALLTAFLLPTDKEYSYEDIKMRCDGGIDDDVLRKFLSMANEAGTVTTREVEEDKLLFKNNNSLEIEQKKIYQEFYCSGRLESVREMTQLDIVRDTSKYFLKICNINEDSDLGQLLKKKGLLEEIKSRIIREDPRKQEIIGRAIRETFTKEYESETIIDLDAVIDNALAEDKVKSLRRKLTFRK